jgi:arylsulfatase A-like enzyme
LIVAAPGDENHLRKETPTIAEFFQKNGYSTDFSGKWHLGDKPDAPGPATSENPLPLLSNNNRSLSAQEGARDRTPPSPVMCRSPRNVGEGRLSSGDMTVV